VVESAMTALRLHSSGYPAVATFGASVSEEQLSLLQEIHGGVILSYDNDSSGERAIQRIVDGLKGFVPIEIVPALEGEKSDLGDVKYDQIDAIIAARIPLFRAQTELQYLRKGA
jgi:DNA primase